ncbi:MAG: hypothetical protein M0Z57_06440 [Deltaproteobacteria bacterium]|jgi:hypothetical protein|uniref:DUF1640 domain-containing protein n=1 Tax=Candidatus Acidulodesulfobacterium acidiphilum TaxID=2597224 RepID=A0A520XF05_9DELT|nr:hypothetical protein [Deltaproteobacteria bacterium]RZV39736.1 MAG: hypothetical protein EVJ48_03355 [Candidatus Acidulodesulfobacterium acidiphilum]
MDTLAYAKKLIEVGVPQKQAEVQAEALSDAFKGEVATKGDIKELENKIKDLEIRMIKWFSSIIIGLVISIFIALLRYIK